MGNINPSPCMAKVLAISANTPYGAIDITTLTNCIITSFSFSVLSIIGRPRSPIINKQIAKSNVKKIICNMLPSANAATGLSGTRSINTCVNGGASGAINSLCDVGERSNDLPGPMLIETMIASEIASAVVNKNKKKALMPTRPNLLMSPMPQTPQTNEKVTSGTTSILSKLIKTVPTT